MALADAGLAWSDIQASYLSRMYLPATSGARILRKLGGTDMPIVDIEAACASGGAALRQGVLAIRSGECDVVMVLRSEEHTSELQSLMRISYAVFCLKKK